MAVEGSGTHAGQSPNSSSTLQPTSLPYAGFPQAHWKKFWSTNPLLERLMRETKRRADVVGIFPDDASILRLVGSVF